MKLLGVPISNKLFKTWVKLLVYPLAPFFLTEELKSQVISLQLIRGEFRNTLQDLSFHDSYTTYAVSSQATWVTLLSSTDFESFSKELRLEPLQLQTKLGRGQAQNETSDVEGKTMLELSYKLWHSFSFETQKRWLEKFISEDRADCLSGTLSKKEWRAINKRYPGVNQIVRFTDRSSPNCFATTLAAMLKVEQAKSVSSLWLQRETFSREIEKRGYKKVAQNTSDLPDSSTPVWENDNGIQHACFYLGDDLVFNKDAQAWFAPRQILRLESVLESWQDFQVSVYVKH